MRGLNAFSRGAVRWCATAAVVAGGPGRLPGSLRFLGATAIAVLRFVQDIPLRPGDREL